MNVLNTKRFFRPSKAEQWLACGYSVAIAPLFPATTNAAAENGTKHHGIASTHLENGTVSKIAGINLYLKEVRKDVSEFSQLFIERKVVVVKDLCEGTLDSAVILPNWRRMLDLKWGTSAVHATDNPQLKLYANGLLNEFPADDLDDPLTLTIVQPNGKTGLPVKNWDTTARQVIKFMDKVNAAIDEGLKPVPKAVAGSHCFWCPGKMFCDAYLKRSRG